MNEKKKQLSELRDVLARYERFSTSEDVRKTIEDVDEIMRLNEPPLNLLVNPSPNAGKAWDVREGARTYSRILKTISEETKRAIKQLEQDITEGNDNNE